MLEFREVYLAKLPPSVLTFLLPPTNFHWKTEKILTGENWEKFTPKTMKTMNTLETQSITASQSNVVIKAIILILNALCGVTIYCCLSLAGIKAEFTNVFNILGGLFGAIMLVTWLAWPIRK